MAFQSRGFSGSNILCLLANFRFLNSYTEKIVAINSGTTLIYLPSDPTRGKELRVVHAKPLIDPHVSPNSHVIKPRQHSASADATSSCHVTTPRIICGIIFLIQDPIHVVLGTSFLNSQVF